MDGTDEALEVDVAAELGATRAISTQQLTLYIPDRDRFGNELGTQRAWVLEGAALLARIGGGVLRGFVHRLGKQTRQGEVIVDFDGALYRITDFEGT